jgi:hypothetical protein
MTKVPPAVRDYFAKIGKKGGESATPKKAWHARVNGAQPCAPGKKRGRPRKEAR